MRGRALRVLAPPLILLGLGLGTGCDQRIGQPDVVPADRAAIREAERLDAIQAAIEGGDLDGARAALAEARADGLDHPRLPYFEAQLLLGTGEDADTRAAIDRLAEAIAGSPRWIEPRLLMAEAYLRLDRLASAASVYDDFDRLFPESPFGPYGRGTIALRQGRNTEAGTLLATALDRDPDFAPALRAKAWLAELDGDHATRRRLLLHYVTLVPDDAAAWAQLGDSHHQQGFPEDARRAYERSYRLAPRPQTAAQLAALARARGDQAEAERWAQRQ